MAFKDKQPVVQDINYDEHGSPIATVSGIDGVRLGVDTTGTVEIGPSSLGDIASEATASGIAQTLVSLDGKDFASETTLVSLDGKDFATETTLSGVAQTVSSLDGKYFATESSLSGFRADFNAEDFAQETTLSGLAQTATSLDGKDFATETTLSGVDTKLGTIDSVLDSIKDTDGIKKITDALPAGTNVIGEVGLDLPKLTHQLPDPDSFDLGERGQPYVDFKDRLVTKSQVSSDEGAYRDDFSAALENSLTGTLTFGATKVVTGVGTAFTTELTTDSVIRLTSDTQNVAVKVASIFSDTLLKLEEAYTGTAASGAGTESKWKLDPGTGMTISQAASNLTIATGTTASSASHVSRIFEGPGDVAGLLSVSQRIANQELKLGLVGKSTQSEATFVFDGVLNNKIKLRTASANGTLDESTYTMPVGETTDTLNEYKVEVAHEFVRFFVNGNLAAQKSFHNPGPYEYMGAGVHVVNTGTPSSSTDFVVDALFIARKTVIEVKVSGALDNLRVDSGGNLQVNIAASSQALPLIVNPNFEASDGAIVANQYKRVIEYTIPDDYDGWLIRFSSFQNETSKSRLVAVREMGSYDFLGSYVAGTQYVAPQWSSVIEAEVTTATSSSGASPKTMTVTYTNQDGVAGRTGTISVPKSSIVGSRFKLVMQTGDIGVRSIENITDDSSNAGAFDIIGFIQLAYHNDLSNTIQLETNYQPGAIAFPTGTVLAVEYQGGTVSKDRLFDMLIQLVAVVPE